MTSSRSYSLLTVGQLLLLGSLGRTVQRRVTLSVLNCGSVCAFSGHFY